MLLTNDYGAPDAFVKAIEGDPYTKGDADFSATELLKPVCWRTMERGHANNASLLNAKE